MVGKQGLNVNIIGNFIRFIISVPHVLVLYRKPGLSLPKISLALEMKELKYSSKLGLTTLKEICMGQIWAFILSCAASYKTA